MLAWRTAGQKFLDEFRELNPFLVPQKGENRCGSLWNLLTPRHRLDPDCCNPGEEDTDAGLCFADHAEPWTHTPTGMSVLVAHAYCGHRERPRGLSGSPGAAPVPQARGAD